MLKCNFFPSGLDAFQGKKLPCHQHHPETINFVRRLANRRTLERRARYRSNNSGSLFAGGGGLLRQYHRGVGAGLAEAAQFMVGAGLLGWLGLESVMWDRFYVGPEMPPPLRPTIGIE